MKTVAISGYFNPLQPGHYKLFEEASKLGDKLIVILNNDKQVKLKGSFPVFSEEERFKAIGHIDLVDEVFLSIDKDKTVCDSLELVKPDIFANGGDQKKDTIPEYETCEELGIEMVFNVGGEKTDSSSSVIERIRNDLYEKELKEFSTDVYDFDQVIMNGDWKGKFDLQLAFESFLDNLKHVWGI